MFNNLNKYCVNGLILLIVVCSNPYLFAQNIESKNNESYMVHEDINVLVTGEWHYPTPWVLNNLLLHDFISEPMKRFWKIQQNISNDYENSENYLNLISLPEFQSQSKIISVGEGTSGLAPYLSLELESKGVSVTGVDLWYGKEEVMESMLEFERQYYKKYQNILKYGNAETLDQFSNNSVDLILAHYLFDHLPKSVKKDFVLRSLELLKSGGSFRVNYANSFSRKKVLGEFISEIKSASNHDFEWGLIGFESKINPIEDPLSELLPAEYLQQAFITLEQSFFNDYLNRVLEKYSDASLELQKSIFYNQLNGRYRYLNKNSEYTQQYLFIIKKK